jgi:ABC-2 type transport system permease protein
MRLLAVVKRSLREQLRDRLALVLVLIVAPFFVLLYALMFPSGATQYRVLVLNHDAGAPASAGRLQAGDEAIQALQSVRYKNGKPMLNVERVTDRADAEKRLRDRDAALLVLIPRDFSQAIAGARVGDRSTEATPTLVGDLTNPTYVVAGVLVGGSLDAYVQGAIGGRSPVHLAEEPLGGSATRTEFEAYVPGLIVFSVMMLVFLTSMTVAREVESGTLRRLQLTRMTSLDLMAGVSAVPVLVGIAAVLLTFGTAVAVGFHSQGPIWVAVLTCAVTSLSIVGAGLVVGALAKTVTQAFLLANFPLILFMFFSGAIFPIPRMTLFRVFGHAFGPYDLLPPTHAVVALGKVLTLGAGLGDVVFELAALAVLSLAYFALGVWLFKRRWLARR